MSIRQTELAGSWYPATEAECLAAFEGFEVKAVASQRPPPLRGGLVPHAGWTYSGGIGYNVFREIARSPRQLDTIVLLAGHLGPRSGPRIMASGQIATPLGPIETDTALAQALLDSHELAVEEPDSHQQDNGAEVNFPIIRHLLPDAKLLVIGVPPTEEAMVLAQALTQAARGLQREIAVVGSTDLTHYGPNYGWAPHGTGDAALRWVREDNDAAFIQAVQTMAPDSMLHTAWRRHNACCPGAAACAVAVAKSQGSATAEVLQYATSADERQDASFVGYVGMVF